MATQQQEANAEVDKFQARKSNTQWTNVTREKLVLGLKKRINDPSQIDQGNANLCGPAVFFHDLAIKNPVAYAKAAIDLWEQGSAKIDNLVITPSDALKTYKIPINKDGKADIDPADWILLASLRNTGQWFFPYQATQDTVGGMTLPARLEYWFKQAGFTVRNQTKLVGTPGIAICRENKPSNNTTPQPKYTCENSNAKEASGMFNTGYTVALLINAEMLPKQQQGNIITRELPNHWIGLASQITTNPGIINLSYYSWGKKYVADIPYMKFFNNYHGYIACKM